MDNPAYALGLSRRLRVTYLMQAYQQTDLGLRECAAYIVRKGAHCTLDRHRPGAIRIDATATS